ncbi:MAG: GFA family protein [Kiloniellales bacterium]
MNTSEEYSGGCFCGQLRYRVEGPIDSVTHCHCAMCRRASGGTLMTWLTVPRARFTFTQGTPATFNSSDHGARTFCTNCGTHIGFTSTHDPASIDVTVVSLDHPEDFPPDRHIWTESRLPWLHIDGQLPAYEKWTPPEAER